MYCVECGKKNPDHARFCAFCGVKLHPAQAGEPKSETPPAVQADPPPVAEDAPPVDAPAEGDDDPKDAPRESVRKSKEAQTPRPAPDKSPAKARTGPAASRSSDALAKDITPRAPRPAAQKSTRRAPMDLSRTVRPTMENPAQPYRGEAPVTRPPSRREFTELKPSAPPAAKDVPPPEKTAASKPDKPTAKPVQHRPPNKVVTSSGAEEEVPARKPPVKKAYQRKGESPNTYVPDRVRQTKIDLFFEEDEEDARDDLYEENGRGRRRLISVVSSVVVLALFAFIFWLLAMPGGQVFRASMGLSAPASAYKLYGDQLRAEGRVVESAAAYDNAFRLDPKNYQYALLTAQTQELVGNLERAEQAYGFCIQLNEAMAEPYRLLALLYERQGNSDSQLRVLLYGVENTDDATLKEMLSALQAANPAPSADPAPSPPSMEGLPAG